MKTVYVRPYDFANYVLERVKRRQNRSERLEKEKMLEEAGQAHGLELQNRGTMIKYDSVPRRHTTQVWQDAMADPHRSHHTNPIDQLPYGKVSAKVMV